MCISHLSSERNKKKFLEEARKKGYIRVWKVCDYKKTGWLRREKYRPGLQRAIGFVKKNINHGFHVYLSLSKAKMDKIILESGDQGITYVKICYAKPSWLKGLSLRTKEAVFTHLVFPEWDKGDMTIREFRTICKGDQNDSKRTI